MALSDRDYMRKGGSSFAMPANWTLRLIVVLVVAWLLQSLLESWLHVDVVRWFGLSRDGLLHGKVWGLLTYALLHGGSGHIFWNCLSLWFFGDLIERSTAPEDIPRFGIVAAIAGGVGFLVGGVLGGASGVVIGASGIVSAVLAFGAVRYPHMTIRLFFVIPCPMWLFAILLFAGDIRAAVTAEQSGVAYWAHIGGAVYGLVVHRFGVVPHVRLPRLRLSRKGAPKKSPHAAADRLVRPDHEQQRVDTLLDKISREGIAALTDEERAFLNDASKRYR